MVPTPPDERDTGTDTGRLTPIRRRRMLALGAGMGAALLAGCSSDSAPGDGADPTPSATTTDAGGAVGTFRLLISDQPVAIDEFDALTVSFDRARIFRGQADEDDDDATGAQTAATPGDESDGTPAANGTASPTRTEPSEPDASTEQAAVPDEETDDPDERADDPDEADASVSVIDLGGASVDLTEVVGDKAIRVFDGDLSEGRYAKIELYAADVEGIVDGGAVDVKIPSGKLQIVHPFEVRAGETLDFVFDINVVKKGNSGGYNLLPVISESGVAGEDVDVEEVGSAGPNAGPEDADSEESTEDQPADPDTEEDEDGDADDTDDEDETPAPEDAGDGPPEPAGTDG